ncbi:hypothetical protein [Muricoccus pecuniae]|uniref:Concanavalin A-like lectin/glucanases superfamily protein n=1 Tax=Muricoccus pecuniae TaxID=693023 RepID=A0A840XUY4_9PROT|nr:hypothetical protein [Roseomonas pecuniae]MBB5692345.1 hypothetical protein [Roseomonas pecuniae]
MIGATPSIHALGGGPLRLIAPGSLLSPILPARTTAGLALGADGTSWAEVAAGTPRFHGVGRRLLIEGQRTNGVRNPRAEGAVAGTPGTLPTNWNLQPVSGVLCQVVGMVSTGGMSALRLRLSGTAGVTGAFIISFDAANACPAGPNQTWTGAAFLRRVEAPAPFGGYGLRLIARDGAGATVESVINTLVAPSSAMERRSHTRTTGTSTSITHMQHGLSLSCTAGQAYDETLEIGWPTLEQGAFGSSPILPPAGAPAAATRAADAPSLALTPAQAARGTLVGTFMLPQAAASSNQGLLCLDDGTLSNRIVLRNASGGSLVNALKVISGTVIGIGSLGSLTSGVPFKVALAWDAAGTSVSMGGSASVNVAGAIPSISRLLIGHNQSDLVGATFGEIGALDLHPTRLPDAALQALTAN